MPSMRGPQQGGQARAPLASRLREALDPRRFGVQIALAVLTLAGANLVLTGAYIGSRFVQLQSEDTGRRFQAVADNLSLGAAPLVITHDYGALEQMLGAAARFPGMRTLAVAGPDGQVLSRVDRAPRGRAQIAFDYGRLHVPSGAQPRLQWLDARGHVAARRVFSIPRGLEIWYPIESGHLGWLYLRASVDEIRSEVALLARDSLLVLLALSLGGVGLLYLLLRPRVRALERATAFARRLGRADAGSLPVYPRTLELEVLGRTLNETSRKLLQQEAAVRANQVRIEAIVENLTDGVVLTDAAGHLLSVNSAFCGMLGYPREQVLGSSLARFLPGLLAGAGAHDPVPDLDAHCTERGSLRELQGLRADGAWLPVALGMRRFHIDERAFYVGALHDLSERNRWIAELQHTRDAALAASRAKSDFLAAMSHEIRTPMNGMIGMLDLLLQSSLDEQQKRMADISRGSALALLAIIDDILDLAKIEAGKLRILDEPLELEPLVHEVVLLFEESARRKGIELSAWVDPAVPLNLRGDALRIRQLLANLLSNAVKFTGNEGDVAGRVQLRVEPCSDASPGSRLCIIVRDNGIGMEPGALQRLFVPFEQADSYTSKRFGGTGLGLSICHHLVQMMGGHIDVQSQPGQGSEFRIALPLRVDGEPRANVSQALQGQQCVVIGADRLRAHDLVACLQASGAQARWIEHVAAVPAGAALLWLPDTPALDIDAPWQLRLGNGARRAPRWLRPGVVQFDLNLLGRDLLEQAVLLAMHGPEPAREVRVEAAVQPAAALPRDRADAQQRGRLVLVAEDNEINQQVIRLQLQRLGLWADIVDDGEKALQRWRQEPYVLVLSDLHMPRMDGFALAQAIRQEELRLGRMHTPVVALTAAAQPQELQRALRAGMDAHMTKPLALQTMRETLRPFVPAIAASAEAAEAQAAQAVVDFDAGVLPGLVGDDSATLRELLEQYEQELRHALPEFEQLARVGGEALVQAAHRLKSSSRSVGALAVADCLQRLESAAADGAADGAAQAQALAQLPELAQRALRAIAAATL